jgi:hypothetical protein
MTFGEVAPIAGKIVRAATFRQGFSPDDHSDYLINSIHMAFLHQLQSFLNWPRKWQSSMGYSFSTMSFSMAFSSSFAAGGWFHSTLIFPVAMASASRRAARVTALDDGCGQL